MPYTALYRKKRPKTFGGIVGQPHVVRTLTNQLSAGQITHAYLFCGTRGTGKTSAAKIFSRAVNCEHPQDGNPCNECDTCKGILAERNMGVIEIDAASNNGVENIRDLREEVKYPPTEGRYKVYIIDEAHMLTTSAFNALLKTLEEPPAHVIFILATTDPQKIPATILSRCQRYDFKRLTVRDMVDTMSQYLAEEAVAADDDALHYIASVSDGAMRDALSILDQCLSHYGGEALTLSNVLELLGAVDRKTLFDFTDALSRFDSGYALTIINTVVRDGRDIGQFTADVLRHFRDLLVAAQIKTHDELLDHSGEMAARIKKQSAGVTSETLINYIRVFSELLNELRYSTQARMALEVCAIRLCHPETEAGNDSILARLAKLEQAVSEGTGIISATGMGRSASALEIPAENASSVREVSSSVAGDIPAASSPPVFASVPVIPASEPNTPAPISWEEPTPAPILSAPPSPGHPTTPASVKPETAAIIKQNWTQFCGEFKPPLKSMLQRCGIEIYEGMLRIICENDAVLKIVKDKQPQILEKLIPRFSLPAMLNLAFVVQDGYNIPRSVPAKPETTATPNPTSRNAAETPAPYPAADDWAAFGEQVDINDAW